MKTWILNIGFSYLLYFGFFANAIALEEFASASLDNVSTVVEMRSTRASDLVACQMPRPEICYELYQPVCAVRQRERACLTMSCPPTEQVVYANDCKACADRLVLGFRNVATCPAW